ncbi:hypothetical protein [Vibrio fluvialis]|uniref:hypothetical protein n=1 Tax=Vibrio fluvialis TaxID=676 RepID=UPI001302C15E|nr:hypothetical protein [Vibrio fluvialis]
MTEFTATVATIDDTIDEANETFTLTVGGVEGTATIVDKRCGTDDQQCEHGGRRVRRGGR